MSRSLISHIVLDTDFSKCALLAGTSVRRFLRRFLPSNMRSRIPGRLWPDHPKK